MPKRTGFPLRKLKAWRRWRRNETLKRDKFLETWWRRHERIRHTWRRWHHERRVLLVELVWLRHGLRWHVVGKGRLIVLLITSTLFLSLDLVVLLMIVSPAFLFISHIIPCVLKEPSLLFNHLLLCHVAWVGLA